MTTYRIPYVGEGKEGCLASMQIDMDEAACYADDDWRHGKAMISAWGWQKQAEFEDVLAHMRAVHGMPDCFKPNDDPELIESITKIHVGYHDTIPPKANFGKLAPAHELHDLSTDIADG